MSDAVFWVWVGFLVGIAWGTGQAILIDWLLSPTSGEHGALVRGLRTIARWVDPG